jgi:hypothetical protein
VAAGPESCVLAGATGLPDGIVGPRSGWLEASVTSGRQVGASVGESHGWTLQMGFMHGIKVLCIVGTFLSAQHRLFARLLKNIFYGKRVFTEHIDLMAQEIGTRYVENLVINPTDLPCQSFSLFFLPVLAQTNAAR